MFNKSHEKIRVHAAAVLNFEIGIHVFETMGANRENLRTFVASFLRYHVRRIAHFRGHIYNTIMCVCVYLSSLKEKKKS